MRPFSAHEEAGALAATPSLLRVRNPEPVLNMGDEMFFVRRAASSLKQGFDLPSVNATAVVHEVKRRP
jgi:hypothetical protein